MQQNFNKYLSVLAVIAILLANATVSMAAEDLNAINADVFSADKEVLIADATMDNTVGETVSDENETSSNNNVIITMMPDGDESIEVVADENTANADKDILSDEAGGDTITEKLADAISVEVLDEKEEFLKRLKQELDLTKADYHQLLNNITDAKNRLEIVSDERVDLDHQMKNISIQEDIITEKLINVMKQVVEKENGIKGLYEGIEMREVALEYQKSLLQDYIKLMYQEENEILSLEKDGSISAFKLLLSDGSVGENLRKLDYLNLLNEAGLQITDRLGEIFWELEAQKKKLTEDKAKMDELRIELVQQKNQLNAQKKAKQQLWNITSGQEEVYAQLVEQEMKQQEEIVNEIQNLRSVYLAAEDKYQKDPGNFNINDYNLDPKSKMIYDFQVKNLGKSSCSFDWPVRPNRGISAYFRNDGDGYYGRFGMIHNAVDIPVWQGSPVYAPAEGVVYVTKENGYGYSYIIMSHACGFNTTYGHMSEILVEEGQYLEKGTIIGLSGGMPGTLGAGYMTTGPHLHYEMRLNGMYVDPMNHLPLEVFEEGELIEKYQESWESAVLRSTFEAIER